MHSNFHPGYLYPPAFLVRCDFLRRYEVSVSHVLVFRAMPPANTLVRRVNWNAFAPVVQARPCPVFGRPVHRIDYGLALLLKPFGPNLAIGALPSGFKPGPRGVTPGFGYGSPSPGPSGTSTHLTITLSRTHYGVVCHPTPHSPILAFPLVWDYPCGMMPGFPR